MNDGVPPLYVDLLEIILILLSKNLKLTQNSDGHFFYLTRKGVK
jgi:hypothetical protein